MSKDEERVIRLRKKLDKNDLGNSKAYQYIYELKQLTPVISYELLQKTGIGKSLNAWIRENKNSKEIRSVTIREAEKVLGRWKEAMQR